MVIQTISKNYKVIRTLSGSSQIEAYLCRDDRTASEDRFLVQGLTGSGFSRKIIPYFMELSSRHEADDLLDCFTGKGSLWLVFRYFGCKTLKEKMKEPFLQAERLEASRTLMDRLAAQNLPYYLQYEALNPRNLVVSDACEVFSNYLLTEPELFDSCGMDEVCGRLADFFRLLFAPELEEKVSRGLEEFILGLDEKDYPDYIAVYRDYRRLYDILAKLQSEGQLKPKGWLVRMWDKFKIFLKKLWKCLYIALLIGLIAYLIYICVKPADMPVSRIEFESIGTLKIRDSGETMENGDNPE